MTAGSSPEHLNGKCLTVNEDLFFTKITGTDSMKRDVRITILKSEVDQKLAEQYAVSGFEACPFHKAGQVFVSDGEHKPEGLCEYAWKPIKEMVKILSEGELLQPRGTWMVDDDKGVFSCVDGLRPVIMLIEAIHADEDE